MSEGGRRWAYVDISPKELAAIVCPGVREISVNSEIPSDAIFVTAHITVDSNQIRALFEHPSFELVPDGARIPFCNLWITAREKPSASDEINDVTT